MLVAFMGAPGSGKTTVAMGITYELKKMGLAAEYLPEIAREMIVEQKLAKKPIKLEQNELFWLERKMHRDNKMASPDSFVIADVAAFQCALYGYTGPVSRDDIDIYDLVFFCKLPPEDKNLVDANRIHDYPQSLELQEKALKLIDTYKLSHVEMLDQATPEQRVAYAMTAILDRERDIAPIL